METSHHQSSNLLLSILYISTEVLDIFLKLRKCVHPSMIQYIFKNKKVAIEKYIVQHFQSWTAFKTEAEGGYKVKSLPSLLVQTSSKSPFSSHYDPPFLTPEARWIIQTLANLHVKTILKSTKNLKVIFKYVITPFAITVPVEAAYQIWRVTKVLSMGKVHTHI